MVILFYFFLDWKILVLVFDIFDALCCVVGFCNESMVSSNSFQFDKEQTVKWKLWYPYQPSRPPSVWLRCRFFFCFFLSLCLWCKIWWLMSQVFIGLISRFFLLPSSHNEACKIAPFLRISGQCCHKWHKICCLVMKLYTKLFCVNFLSAVMFSCLKAILLSVFWVFKIEKITI